MQHYLRKNNIMMKIKDTNQPINFVLDGQF